MSFLEHYEDVEKRMVGDVELTEELKEMVMSACDVQGILESWNVRPQLRGRQWNGYCPDHVLHDGHAQHAPKWTMNSVNGDCFCFTSSKASNFVYVAKRLYRLPSVEETIRVLTNGERLVLPLPEFVVNPKTEKARREQSRISQEHLKEGVRLVKGLLARGGRLSDECLAYFANDGITRDTLDFLGVCSVEHGYLAGRAVIPFLNSKRAICGYVAVNYMGKEWWVRQEYDRQHRIDGSVTIPSVVGRYRKTLYCRGFQSRNHLYGQYEVLNGGEGLDRLVIVEGERDAMKLLQEGVDCVSVHGTALKDEQLVMIKAMNPRSVLLGFDMDSAGCQATVRAVERLYPEVESLGVMNFPDGKDPKRFGADELGIIIGRADSDSDANYAERQEILRRSLEESRRRRGRRSQPSSH